MKQEQNLHGMEWGTALQKCIPEVPICIPCAETLLRQTYGAVDPQPKVLQYLQGKYGHGRETIGFVIDTPALLQAARAAGHRNATRAAKVMIPPSDGEVDGMGMCTECATACHKTKRLLAAVARGEPGIEVV